MAEPADDELMARLQKGERDAFELLLRRHLGSIRAYAGRLLRSDADADDIAQDVFLKLWQRPQRYRPGRVKLSTWLHQVAHNAAIDLIRKRRPEAAEPEDVAAPAAATETTALDAHISALPLNQRTAVALCLIGGHSAEEAGQIMGLGRRAVESLIARARRTLRAAIAAEAQ